MKTLINLVLLLIAYNTQAQFNYYFGNLHAHTAYSDGDQDSATSHITNPLQAFNYAKLSLHTDFYGISEHNHLNAGMTSPSRFHQGIADANIINNDGSFVALYGQEWGVISGGGHVLVYGVDSLIGWDNADYDIYVPKNNYTALWNTINAHPQSFAYLAHPQSSDYNNFFTSTLSASADNAIVGMAARSGPAFSTNTSYSDAPSSNYIARYNDALSKGYHLGVGIDHDTHNSVFSRQTAGRLVVVADQLTRNNVLDAMKKMRFYASDDWNTKVDFKINSQPIGSIYSHAENPTISVNVSDPDGESVTSITVYYGVPGSGNQPAVLTTSNSNSLTYTHTITANSTYYYYLHIVQADGDNIWTSPIWYTRKASITANPPVTAFSLPATACVGDNISLSDISTNNPTTWSWTAIGANTPAFVTQHPVISYATAGVYTVSLIASNSIGTGLPVTHTITVTSCVTGSDNKTTLPNTFQVYPNPFTNEVTFSGLNFMKNKTLLIFNSIGKIVYQQLIGTDDRISLNLSQYADGVYFIKVDNYIKSIVKNSMSK